jgi:DNA-directed RNA polymerase specialized sigma24 family protein
MYLSKVVRNFVIDFQRSRRAREVAVGGTMELEPLSGSQPEPMTAATHLKELRKVGIRAWAVLEARDRKLICERLHRDLDNDAIASRLRLSAGALRTAMSRAQSRYLLQVRRLAPEFFPEEA